MCSDMQTNDSAWSRGMRLRGFVDFSAMDLAAVVSDRPSGYASGAGASQRADL
jgi:hypothetical protein